MKKMFKLFVMLFTITLLFSCEGFDTKEYNVKMYVKGIKELRDNYGFYDITIRYPHNTEFNKTFFIIDTLGKYNVGDTLILIKK